MTAINVRIQDNQAHVFSDTVMLDYSSGVFVTTYPKVVTFPLIGSLVAVSGPMALFNMLLHITVIAPRNCDELLADIRGLLPRIAEDDSLASNDYQIMVVGLTGENEMACTSISGTLRPFTMDVRHCEHDKWHSSIEIAKHEIESVCGAAALRTFEDGPIAAAGMILLETQRQVWIKQDGLNSGKRTFTVGGEAMHTCIAGDAITQRVLKRWPDQIGGKIVPSRLVALKAATAAKRGLAIETNADTSNAESSGYVSPEFTTSTTTINSLDSNQPQGSTVTIIDRTAAVTNNAVVVAIGVYSTNALTGGDVKIVKRNSTNNYDVVVNQSFNHPGGGWYDVTLSSPYTVPASDTYYLATFEPSGTLSFTVDVSRAFFVGNATGTNITITESTGAAFPTRYVYRTGYADMTLVTMAQSTPSNVSNARVTLEIDNTAAPGLNTDLTVEVTCNGGTNWTPATLASVGPGQSGRLVIETADTAATAGTSFAARIKTLNAKNVPIHGIGIKVH